MRSCVLTTAAHNLFMSNILIIKLGALGDVVMATSLIRQIQAHHAGDNLWLITAPAYIDIFKHWHGLNVAPFSRHSLMDNLRLIMWMRRMRFLRVYDLQSNDRTSIICALSGIPEKVGNHPRYPYTLHPEDAYTGQCHIHDRMLAVLTAAGIMPARKPPELPAAGTEKKQVAGWLQQHGLKDKSYAILHAGASASHSEKCWPYFLDLARLITAAGCAVVWIGAGAEAAANRHRAQQVGIDASGVFSIIGLAELGQHARFAVTNDSGPMHILACAGIPVFALFGPTNWRRNHAIGQAENVIVAEDLAGEEFRPVPVDKITVDQVVRRLKTKALL